jgi:aminoglycoside 3-N-acetyltransferase
MLTRTELIREFKALGVSPGDTLLVHSSFKSLGGVDGGPQAVIDTLLEVLTESGTLIMPNFNFDFCKGAPWDVRETPSHLGVITELVRKDPRKACLPSVSFASWSQADYLMAERYTSSYNKAVFGKLRKLEGRSWSSG